MSLLNTLVKITSRPKKRVGRGGGSGKGFHTSGRGQKGLKSRRGSKVPVWFEGGQLPLTKRMPMLRGKGRFNVVRKTAEITFNDLSKLDIDVITLESLKLHKVIEPGFNKAKIINTGELTKKITVEGIAVTKGAKEVIEKLGGKVTE